MSEYYTPGPWWFSECVDGSFDVGEGDVALARVSKRRITDGHYGSEGDVRANARLMAMSPQLLETLETVLEFWTSGVECGPKSAVAKRARELVGKTKGTR